MKVIFLDIDGVLNTPKDSIRRYEEWSQGTGKSRDEFGMLFCPQAVANLEKLCSVTGAKVVVSSTWRARGLGWLQTMFQRRDIKAEIIGKTPRYRGLIRGEEIAAWLRDNPVDNYVILDDDTDMLPQQELNFVNTLFEDGFNADCLAKALQIFNGIKSFSNNLR